MNRHQKWYAANKEKKLAYQVEYRKTEQFKELEKARKAKANEYMKAWGKTEKGQRARCHRTIYRNFRHLGFTIDDYDTMYEKQAGKCAICGEHRPKYGQKRHHIDHCHATGKIRGLLCPNCNSALGGFRDSVTTMQNAIAYVQES